MTEFDNLKNMAPEERIKKLKAEEEKRKKEIVEVEGLIKESEGEIELGEELKRVPIPQIRALEINDLFFSPTAKWVFEQRKQVQIKPKEDMFPTAEPPKREASLEDAVEEEAKKVQAVSQAAGGPQYGLITEMSTMTQVYQGIKNVAGEIVSRGYATPQQAERLESYESAMEKIVHESSPILGDDRARGMLVEGKEIITEIRGGYITTREAERGSQTTEKDEMKYKI